MFAGRQRCKHHIHAVVAFADPGSSGEKILKSATEVARIDFGIRHCTIQLERGAEQQLTNGLHAHSHAHSQQHHHHHHDDLHGGAMIDFV